jgi:hypothetical protein
VVVSRLGVDLLPEALVDDEDEEDNRNSEKVED